MSIQTADEIKTNSASATKLADTAADWELIFEQFDAGEARDTVEQVFGKTSKQGRIYRWGFAASSGAACRGLVDLLSRLACGARLRKTQGIDLDAAADLFCQQIHGRSKVNTLDASTTVLWAAALPALTQRMDRSRWLQLLSSLQEFRQSVLELDEPSLPAHLIIAAELGMTMAWRLERLSGCKRMKTSSVKALKSWCQHEHESVSRAIAGGTDARLVLASLIRCQLISETFSSKSKKLSRRQRSIGEDLATWVAAMTTPSGSTAFCSASKKDLRDDLPPEGLLGQAAQFNREALSPAIAAALGQSHSGGRLAWEVSLPEAVCHDADAKVAVLLPEWDGRRGRTHVDYSGETVKIEVYAGRNQVIAGHWQTAIELDAVEQQPCSDWSESCEYSDDDVHYLEIEQNWTGGLVLQRQILLIREDRCLLLADAVLPVPGDEDNSPATIKYSSRFPLRPSVEIESEAETREIFLNDGRRRGLVIPLSAGEWRRGRTAANLDESDDHELIFTAEGQRRLYAPLWFDFQRRRFKRARTWRQLTVADTLRIVGRDEAVGYRIQMGSEQWAVYRSLATPCCRSLLGLHLVAEFFCSRFDPGDGSHEELVTVDENQPDDE